MPRQGSLRAAAGRISAALRRLEFATGSVGFLFGILLMTGDCLRLRPGPDDACARFLRAPESMVWIFLVAAQVAFWFNSVPFQWRWKCEVRDGFGLAFTRDMGAKAALALLLFAAPAVVMAFLQPATMLAHRAAKLAVVNAIGVAVAFVPLVGIWYTRAAITAPAGPGGAARDDKRRIRDYLLLRAHLQRFITFLGMMISLGTLAKGANRHAFVATTGRPDQFPPEYVLLYGAFFTGLLALVYVPIHTRLIAAGTALVDSVFAIDAPETDLKQLSGWHANRKSLEDLLHLEARAADDLRASVSILAPVASGVVSILLGDKLLLRS